MWNQIIHCKECFQQPRSPPGGEYACQDFLYEYDEEGYEGAALSFVL